MEVIRQLIKSQLAQIIGVSQKYVFCDEYGFAGQPEKDTIYFVIKISQSQLLAGYSSVSASVEAVGEENSVIKAQDILTRYALKYNFYTPSVSGYYIQQTCDIPSVQQNFVGVGSGYRNVLSMQLGFVVSTGISDIEVLKIDNVEVPYISASFVYQGNQNSQPFSSLNARTQTDIEFGVFTLSMSVLSSDSDFIEKCLHIALDNGNTQTSVNTNFAFVITINGITLNTNMKLLNFQYSKSTGSIPTINLTFTR